MLALNQSETSPSIRYLLFDDRVKMSKLRVLIQGKPARVMLSRKLTFPDESVLVLAVACDLELGGPLSVFAQSAKAFWFVLANSSPKGIIL
jgi:hypothetical protein